MVSESRNVDERVKQALLLLSSEKKNYIKWHLANKMFNVMLPAKLNIVDKRSKGVGMFMSE